MVSSQIRSYVRYIIEKLIIYRYKDGKVVEPSDDVELTNDNKNEEYSLKVKSVVLSDEGRYRVEAKNDYGEATGEARLKTISK